jgi:hypothetical protein
MMNAIQQMAISAKMLHDSMSTIGANAAGGPSGSGGPMEVGPVAPVDLRAGLVQTLHQSKLTHRLGGFLDLYTHSSREYSHWDSQGREEDSRVRNKWCHRIHSGSTGETTWH